MRSFIVGGPFTDADMQELIDTFKRIERRQPRERFLLIVDDPTADLGRAEAAVRDVLNRTP
jgi:hypothetical protein